MAKLTHAASDVLAAISREHVEAPGGDVESEVVQYAVKTEAEFASVDDARAFRDRLVGSGVIDRLDVRTPPIVLEVVETKAP